jgi:hypothetical protein
MKLKNKGFKVSANAAWDAGQIKMFCEDMIERLGGNAAWSLLSSPMRQAFIAQKAFAVVRGQAKVAVAVDAMDALLFDMQRLLDEQP